MYFDHTRIDLSGIDIRPTDQQITNFVNDCIENDDTGRLLFFKVKMTSTDFGISKTFLYPVYLKLPKGDHQDKNKIAYRGCSISDLSSNRGLWIYDFTPRLFYRFNAIFLSPNGQYIHYQPLTNQTEFIFFRKDLCNFIENYLQDVESWGKQHGGFSIGTDSKSSLAIKINNFCFYVWLSGFDLYYVCTSYKPSKGYYDVRLFGGKDLNFYSVDKYPFTFMEITGNLMPYHQDNFFYYPKDDESPKIFSSGIINQNDVTDWELFDNSYYQQTDLKEKYSIIVDDITIIQYNDPDEFLSGLKVGLTDFFSDARKFSTVVRNGSAVDEKNMMFLDGIFIGIAIRNHIIRQGKI